MKRYLTNSVVEMTQILFDHSAESEGEEHVEEHNNHNANSHADQDILIVLHLFLHGGVAALEVVIVAVRSLSALTTGLLLSLGEIILPTHHAAAEGFVEFTGEPKGVMIPVVDIVDSAAPQLCLDFIPNSLVGLTLVLRGIVIILLKSLLQWVLDGGFQVSRVSQHSSNHHHDEESQDDGEVGAQHTLVLLDGPTASEEGNEDDQSRDDNEDVGGGGVEVNGGVHSIAVIATHILDLVEDIKERGTVHQDPDTAAENSHTEQEDQQIGSEQSVLDQVGDETHLVVSR